MEGGFTADELNAISGPRCQRRKTCSVGHDAGSPSLDLYLRYADRRVDHEAKKILCQLADEEKAHLHSLGALLEQKI